MKTKNFYLMCVTLAMLLSSRVQAQAPQKFNYQAVARNASGVVIVNQTIGVEFGIINIDGANTNMVYVEQNTASTNNLGLFTLEVGGGFPTVGTFSAIDWSKNTKLLSVNIDPTGGTNYSITGSSQLLSVPYALYAENTKDVNAWNRNGNAGTNPANNFIGTVDAQSLAFKVNNKKSGIIDVNNTAFGYSALAANSGISNVAIGSNALEHNTAYDNTAVGAGALYHNTSGYENTAIGSLALDYNQTGSKNVANGKWSMIFNTIGGDNVAVGHSSLYHNTTGSSNVAEGTNALYTLNGGNNSVALGYYADVSSVALSNAVVIGGQAVVNSNDKVRIGNSVVSVIEGQVAYSYPSDARFKFNVNDKAVKGLDFITKLRPVNYQFDTKKFDEHLMQNMPDSIKAQRAQGLDYETSKQVVHTGFLAQEVEAAAKESGYVFDGVHAPQTKEDNYSVAYSQFVVPLVKAVQEQQAMIDELKKSNQALEKSNSELKALIQQWMEKK